MKLTCPLCRKENKVANFFWQDPTAIGNRQQSNQVTCGHCGERWIVEEDPGRIREPVGGK